jgi:hypothetical protein
MTRAFSPHRSCGIETYGLAIGYDESISKRITNKIPDFFP